MKNTSMHTQEYSFQPVNYRLIALAIIILFIGGIVYVSFRSTSLIMFRWFDSFGITDTIMEVRGLYAGIHPGSFVLYNLPDLLWIVSYLLLVNAIIPIEYFANYLFWLLLMPTLAIAHEIMQGLGIMTGSLDIIDILCYLIPTIINLIYFYYEKNF